MPRSHRMNRNFYIILIAILAVLFKVHAQPLGSIGGYVWIDDDRDGIKDANERGFSGVKVHLFGKKQNETYEVGVLSTESSGHYMFILPPGEYYILVDIPEGFKVSDPNQGDNDDVDSDIDSNTGQSPIVMLNGGTNINNISAGFYSPSSQSDLVVTKTADMTSATIGENVTYTIEIENLGPDPALNVVLTHSISEKLILIQADPQPEDGIGNPLIWHIENLDSGEKRIFSVQVTVNGAGANNDLTCATSANEDPNPLNNCETFLIDLMLSVELALFKARSEPGHIALEWMTHSETENAGFHVYRATAEEGPYERITQQIIPGAGTTESKHSYQFTDNGVEAGITYYYQLVDIDFKGHQAMNGPVHATAEALVDYRLLQNYPNPFNAETRIDFSLQHTGYVVLNIHNVLGQNIKTLMSQNMSAGIYSFVWDGKDEFGNSVPTGTYFYVLQVNDFRQSRRMQLLK